MRKPYLVVFLGIVAVLAMVSAADAQKTYTWNIITSPEAEGIWPNQANSKNVFETDLGLLGRVVIDGSGDLGPGLTPVLSANTINRCELAPSYPCDGVNPPPFLLNGNPSEGPPGAGAGTECNVEVNACNTVAIPSAGHEPGDGDVAGSGSYSFLAIHTVGAVTDGKGIAFFSGSYQVIQDAYTCNTCPALGRNKDAAGPDPSTNADCTGAGVPKPCCSGVATGNCNANADNSLLNTTGGAHLRTLSVDLWTTQSTAGAGHSNITLKPTGSLGAGEFPSNGSTNQCGGSVVFQTLSVELCGPDAPAMFTIPNQKVTARTYSTNTTAWASFSSGGASERNCSGPDCYIENHIIPAAIAQDANATAVQMQLATSVLPPDAGVVANATVDSVLFASTTDSLDFDGDTVEDALDACPNDPSNLCVSAGNPFAGGGCTVPGQVVCADKQGYLGCVDAFLCNQRLDVTLNCSGDGVDQNAIAARDAGGAANPVFGTTATPAFGAPAAFFGPFDP